MRVLHAYTRIIIYSTSLLASIGIYLFFSKTTPAGPLLVIKLTQTYAFMAVTYLYFTLLATPLCQTFRSFPYRGMYLYARRAIGISAWYFGLLHAVFAFFGQLGGFSGIGFLSTTYLIALSFSGTALFILTIMAATSMDWIEAKLGHKCWKFIHRFVYLAGMLIILHVLMLGTHFIDLSGSIPQYSFAAIYILFLLEAKRLDTYLMETYPTMPTFGFMTTVIISLILISLTLTNSSGSGPVSLGIHAQHIQIAKEAQSPSTNTASFPGLQGDKTRRYSVNFSHSDTPQANQPTILTFEVYDASSGNKVNLFSRIYEKFIHLIIVDSELNSFAHIHPEPTQHGFNITHQFPHPGIYHLYVDFQPVGAIEQQFAFTLSVGAFDKPLFSHREPDTVLKKTIHPYDITLSYPTPLKAKQMSVGEQSMKFTFTDTRTHQPVTPLKPYLAAFGHLVMINQTTFDYLHLHPSNLTPPAPNAKGGPTVEFLPLGLYGPIKPGIYRIFAQFNPNDSLVVADFTVKVE